MLPPLDMKWINSPEFKKQGEKILDEMQKLFIELEKSKRLTPVNLRNIWCD